MAENQPKISLSQLIGILAESRRSVTCTGATGAAAAYLASQLSAGLGRPLLLVVDSHKTAERYLDDLGLFFGAASAAEVFPAYNVSPFKFASYHNQTAAQRIAGLYRLSSGEAPPVTIAPIGALLQRVIPRNVLTDFAELVMEGETCDRDRLIESLSAGGYVHAALVEEPGDFCVRGGIVDVFPPLFNEPLRIEFFGDMVETIRVFSAATQRKIRSIGEAVILPAREAVLPEDARLEIIRRVRAHAAAIGLPVSRLRSIVDGIKHQGVFPGAEGLLPLIYARLDTVFDYLPSSTQIVVAGTESVLKFAQDFIQRARESYREATAVGRLCVSPDQIYLSAEQAFERLETLRPLWLKSLAVIGSGQSVAASRDVYALTPEDNHRLRDALRDPNVKEHHLQPLVDWMTTHQRAGVAVIVACRSRQRFERLRELLTPYGISLAFNESMPAGGDGLVRVAAGRLSEGFSWPEEKIAVIAEEEIFGARPRRRSRPVRSSVTELIAVADLKSGDFVVHVDHGIGRYDGLVKLRLNGSTNDFLQIEYRGGDRLYLPVDRMNTVQKYLGIEGMAPALDKMGGRSWSAVKARVKRSAERIAGELLKLYASRKVGEGFAFDVVEKELQDFETGFAYEETADQLKAIQDVLHDMSQPHPMDRLICGDVGYGKTEVALRAAFVAAHNGRQVAMLVPTTVLAEQHYGTFSERFERYPVRIACLSRFRSPAQQRRILGELQEGKIDIVIGTHRLLSQDVAFKDLGLLILDEEQRFGVKHKEKLKRLRRNVDVLTLTATPIPRTLHMSLTGIRDISVISTPPEYRQSIVTYVSEFDDAIVAEAIRSELRRNGQIFFIHNSIDSIESVAGRLQRLVPEVRLETAHGRMSEEALEKVMMRFFARDIDMLVCTTIVESGLDIPAANTILVNRADRFGLAQMYQLRGRVGRSDEQAYAYLFIPHESLLTADAQKRLKVLMEHSDLGSGFQIAVSDLRIRGGGTILGASQSGHIAAVGYEMFLELMEQAVAELKGQPQTESLVPEINMELSALIPESYVPDIDQRLSAYRRLSRMTAGSEIKDFKTELTDRYGPPPGEVEHLLTKIRLKIQAVQAGVRKLDVTGKSLFITFSEAHLRNPQGMVDLIKSHPEQYSFSPENILRARLSGYDLPARIQETKNILKQIATYVNN
jgi:transcription-repair coupling factor (superfamily II helicase)